MRDSLGAAVIGGGILGLGTAMKLITAFPHKKIAVLEKEKDPGTHQTGHNSGVIHSGIYYRPGSLKARLCVDGAAQLYDFCHKEKVPHEMCGKIVVATCEAEIPRLEELYKKGTANGVQGLRMLNPQEAMEMEPHVRAVRAMHVPATGIVDFREVTRAYARVFQEKGGTLLTGHAVSRIHGEGDEIRLDTTHGPLRSRALINCAGLHSDRIARGSGVEPPCQIVPFRGEYYQITPQRAHLVRNLIYPVPDPRYPFLGVHFTRMVNGEVEAGPNAVLAFAREGYTKTRISFRDLGEMLSYPGLWRLIFRHWSAAAGELRRSFSRRLFAQTLQKLVPAIGEQDLLAGGAGVRAQAVDRAGGLLDDFVILRRHRMVHVLNAPSPAATSSLAIADYIVDRCRELF